MTNKGSAVNSLGGWWRLWIASSLIYVTVGSYIVLKEFPSAETIEHDPRIFELMSAAAQHILNDRSLIPSEDEPAEGGPKQLDRIQTSVHGPVELRMPNGLTIELLRNTTPEQQATVEAEYVRILKNAAARLQANRVKKLGMFILAPPIAILVMAYSFVWIRSGFRSSSRGQ